MLAQCDAVGNITENEATHTKREHVYKIVGKIYNRCKFLILSLNRMTTLKMTGSIGKICNTHSLDMKV